MTQFITALLLFLALHMVPAISALRAALVAAVGRRAYLIAYSLASILALGWLFHAALQLDFVPLWEPGPLNAWIPIVLTPLGLFFLVAGLSSPNPASITFRKLGAAPGAITAITRHPVLWGFALWAGSHLLANGDLRSVMLFGILFAYSILGMFIVDLRARRRLGDQWPPLAKNSSALPFRAVLAGRTGLRLDAPMIMAISLSALLTVWLLLGGHAMLFGADPLSMAAR